MTEQPIFTTVQGSMDSFWAELEREGRDHPSWCKRCERRKWLFERLGDGTGPWLCGVCEHSPEEFGIRHWSGPQ
jgi:hypothetical protein